MYVDYKTLSDNLESEELEGYFNDFLKQYSDKPKSLSALRQLYELSYRQWGTYELLAPELSEKISKYIISSVNFKSYDIMDTIISIIENLFLVDAFDFIVSQKDTVTSASVKQLISEAEDDYSDSICNPYCDPDDF